MFGIENRYLRPLPPIIIGMVIAVVLLYVGNLINGSAIGDLAVGGVGGWLLWTVVAGVVVYGISIWASDSDIWKVGTREVVYMALGAALYGVLSWIFNTIPVPSIGLVALRPTVVIPIFFGFAFGPVVGFFTGFMGNVLGDALTGWGVFPVWDIGNGLMGLVPGLIWVFRDKKRSGNNLMYVTAALLLLAVILALINPDIEGLWTGGAASVWMWIPLIGLVMLLVSYFVPRLWPWLMAALTVLVLVMAIQALTGEEPSTTAFIVLLVWAIINGALAYLLFRRREEIAEALSDDDTRNIVVWGTLGVIIGMAFAVIGERFISEYGWMEAFVGLFIPLAGPNTLFAILLTPLLYGAWRQAQAQSGR